MKLLLISSTLLVLALAKPEGTYHQQYQYHQTSSSYKNNELQHKNDEEGFYSKHGDTQGRTEPKVSTYNRQIEYNNPKSQHHFQWNDHGGSRLSGYGENAHNQRYGGSHSSSSGRYESSSSGSAFGGYHSQNANLNSISNRLQEELAAQLRKAVSQQYSEYSRYSSSDSTRAESDFQLLKEELRRNLTEQLQRELRNSYGTQGQRDGFTFSISATGDFENNPNYATRDLNDLQRSLELNLNDKLTEIYNNQYKIYGSHSHGSSHGSTSHGTSHGSTSHGTSHGSMGSHSYVMRPDIVNNPPSLHMPAYQQIVVNPSIQLNQVVHKAQVSIDHILNDALYQANNYQDRYTSYDVALNQLIRDAKRNLTDKIENELMNHYGTQEQRGEYVFSVNRYPVANYKVQDLDELTRQVEKNIENKIRSSFKLIASTRPVYEKSSRLVYLPVTEVRYTIQTDLDRFLENALYKEQQNYKQNNYRPDFNAILRNLEYELKQKLNTIVTEKTSSHYTGSYGTQTSYRPEEIDSLKRELESMYLRKLNDKVQNQQSQYRYEHRSEGNYETHNIDRNIGGETQTIYPETNGNFLHNRGQSHGGGSSHQIEYNYVHYPSTVRVIPTGSNSFQIEGSAIVTNSSDLAEVLAMLTEKMNSQLETAVNKQTTIYSSGDLQSKLREMDEELKRNLTTKLNEVLQQKYGGQHQSGYNYEISTTGEYYPRATYTKEQLNELLQKLQSNLKQQMHSGVQKQYSFSSSSSSSSSSSHSSNSGSNYGGSQQSFDRYYKPSGFRTQAIDLGYGNQYDGMQNDSPQASYHSKSSKQSSEQHSWSSQHQGNVEDKYHQKLINLNEQQPNVEEEIVPKQTYTTHHHHVFANGGRHHHHGGHLYSYGGAYQGPYGHGRRHHHGYSHGLHPHHHHHHRHHYEASSTPSTFEQEIETKSEEVGQQLETDGFTQNPVELGQKQIGSGFEIGQKQDSDEFDYPEELIQEIERSFSKLHIGQQMDNGSGKLKVGQKQDPDEYVDYPEEVGQQVEHGFGELEIGQQQMDNGSGKLKVGQQHVSDEYIDDLEFDQQVKHGFGKLEIGQQQMDNGSGKLKVGQQQESSEFGQQRGFGKLEIGQKQTNNGFGKVEVGQQQVDHSENVGQEVEQDFGKFEVGPQQESNEFGQQQIGESEELGQQQVQHGFGKLEISQQQTNNGFGKLEVGQQQESSEFGQQQVDQSEELGQQIEHGFGKLEIGQQQESNEFGQQQIAESEELGQQQVQHGFGKLEIDQQQINNGFGKLEVGQSEEVNRHNHSQQFNHQQMHHGYIGHTNWTVLHRNTTRHHSHNGSRSFNYGYQYHGSSTYAQTSTPKSVASIGQQQVGGFENLSGQHQIQQVQHGYGKVEVGQQQIGESEELGQQQVQHGFGKLEIGQQVDHSENVGQEVEQDFGKFEVGQQQESNEFGQQQIGESEELGQQQLQHGFGKLEIGQQQTNNSFGKFEVGQQQESSEFGQQQVDESEQLGQQIEHGFGKLEIGQQQTNNSFGKFEVGQQQESSEFGQQQVDESEQLGQQIEHSFGKLEIGQQQESNEFGQQQIAESEELGQQQVQHGFGKLEIGQQQINNGFGKLEVGQQQQSSESGQQLQHGFGKLEIGQQQVNNFESNTGHYEEMGQQTEQYLEVGQQQQHGFSNLNQQHQLNANNQNHYASQHFINQEAYNRPNTHRQINTNQGNRQTLGYHQISGSYVASSHSSRYGSNSRVQTHQILSSNQNPQVHINSHEESSSEEHSHSQHQHSNNYGSSQVQIQPQLEVHEDSTQLQQKPITPKLTGYGYGQHNAHNQIAQSSQSSRYGSQQAIVPNQIAQSSYGHSFSSSNSESQHPVEIIEESTEQPHFWSNWGGKISNAYASVKNKTKSYFSDE